MCASFDARRVDAPTRSEPTRRVFLQTNIHAFFYSEADQNVRCAPPMLPSCACATHVCNASTVRALSDRRVRVAGPPLLCQANFVFVCLLLLVEWLVTGRLGGEWAALGVECYYDGRRVQGSATTAPLLPPGEAPRPRDVHDDDDADVWRGLLKLLRRILILADGCRCQFAGKDAFLWVQEFIAQLTKTCSRAARDMAAIILYRLIREHGKSDCDAAGNLEANGMVDKAARSRDSADESAPTTIDGSSSRAVCLHAARFRRQPEHDDQDKHARGRGSPDAYARFYVPQKAIERWSMTAAAGWTGSAEFHQTAADGAGSRVFRRRDWCGCSECVHDPLLMSPRCTRRSDVGTRESSSLQRATPEQLSALVRVGLVVLRAALRAGLCTTPPVQHAASLTCVCGCIVCRGVCLADSAGPSSSAFL